MPNAQKKTKLTKTFIEELSPATKEYSVWDTKCDGFHVRVMPSGAKFYYVFYRNERNEQRRKSLGRVSSMVPDQARRKAQAIVADVRRGFDQFEEMKRLNEVPTLAQTWPDYLEHHSLAKKSEPSVRQDTRLWKRHLKPVFGKVPVSEITSSDIRKWHAQKKSTPYEANRALSLLSVMLSFNHEHLDGNPCQHVQKFHESPRQVELSSDQMKSIWCALDEDHDLGASTLVKLLILTGARRGEALKAEWKEFDFVEHVWNVPSDHIKGGVRHGLTIQRALTDECLTILKKWKEVGPNKTGLAFPSPLDKNRQRYDVAAIWKRVKRRTGIHNIRLHDMRHNFATTALRNGHSLGEIGHALGHRDQRTTARYAKYASGTRLNVAEAVSSAVLDRGDTSGPEIGS